MPASGTDQADVGAQAHDGPAPRAAGMVAAQVQHIPQTQGERWPRGRRVRSAQSSVAPVKVKAPIRKAGTTTTPRPLRSRRRSAPTASTPARAVR